MNDATPASEPPARPSDADLAACRTSLRVFLEDNPKSSVEIISDPEHGNSLRIVNPWGDESISTYIPADPDRLFNALNSVVLPERYSAIYHKDTKDIEIIFTAFPLGSGREDLPARKFTFIHRGQELTCEYAPASERLLAIAKYTVPVAQSATQYRGIYSFNMLENIGESDGLEDADFEMGLPVCFWIRTIDWDESRILALMRELNFYMYYYDRKSPIISIHSPKIESSAGQPRPRFRDGKFPGIISSRELDEHLLRFWSASITGDPASRFLYSFRIIEYASVLYLESGAKDKVRRFLSSPSALDDIDKLTESVLSIVQSTNLDPPVKFEALIKDVVPADILWTELNRNKSSFDKTSTFDGGFSVEPLMKDIKDAKGFGPNGMTAFAKRLRDIRNALAHGRDQKSVLPLTPTSHNLERLQPWASIIEFVASEVIVYRNRR
ncbi:hypothetical protein [Methylobacterium sp. J-076]|uniref:hypothetical protein n=1 Tax=Methylobacterium sp. J-076 TaxID=2836655 RepID=UPI001FBAA382|nr:hypothetical protein [Methylobacterium sp. J-076]MCJ2012760.1 hypothetical protein [Methylobacterium sp. J-076]